MDGLVMGIEKAPKMNVEVLRTCNCDILNH